MMNTEFKNKKVLFVSPHTNDSEFGCGGMMSRMLREGADVYYVAFSDCKDAIPDHLPANILEVEMWKSMKGLGVKTDNVTLFDYPVRRFDTHRQEILEDLVKIRKEIMPDIVFIPMSSDIHQDHNVIYNEGVRTFKMYTLFGYEQPWNILDGHPSKAIFQVSGQDIENKINAIQCYESQGNNAYTKGDYIKALANTRGINVGYEYGEAFEILRIIL